MFSMDPEWFFSPDANNVQLKFFKDHPDLFPNIKPISGLMDEYEEQKKVISKDVGPH